jgi:hypothetical protein
MKPSQAISAERVAQEVPTLFGWPLLVISLAAAAVLIPFLFLGEPSGHDFEFHLNSWMEVLSQWKQGILYPRWAALAHYGYGEARFIFYPPASWILGASLGAFLPWSVAPAAYIWITLTASGCSMFMLAGRWLTRHDAIFAAALYAVNPYHLVIVYWRSAFAELLASALLPLLLVPVLQAREKGRRIIVPLSLVVAAAWLTNAPAAVMVNYSLALLLVVVAIQEQSLRPLLYGAVAVILGVALAAFYVLPAAYEERWVDISQVLAYGVRPVDNFLFRMIDDPDHNIFNLLVSTVASAQMMCVAVFFICSRKWRKQTPLLWWILIALAAAPALLMFAPTLPVWMYLPKLRFVQLPWRWLLCFNVAFAMLLAMAFRRWAARLFACAIMLAVLALGWAYLRSPWWDKAADIAEMRENQRHGTGYEGTDEYVPTDSDPYEIKQGTPRATFEGPVEAHIQIQQWGTELKALTVQAPQAGKVSLRLFNFPAWQVEVNGRRIEAESRDVTGQMTIPIAAGESSVGVRFVRTWDRTAGAAISITSLIFLAGLVTLQRRA